MITIPIHTDGVRRDAYPKSASSLSENDSTSKQPLDDDVPKRQAILPDPSIAYLHKQKKAYPKRPPPRRRFISPSCVNVTPFS